MRRIVDGFVLCVAVALYSSSGTAAETFTPYTPEQVPQNVTDLWKDYDARQEPLNVRVVKEWKADGVVTRYVTFTVGTFQGSDARIAAYYSFPDGGGKHAAFVWSHGGGQRAERGRGIYFATQGFATIDINWTPPGATTASQLRGRCCFGKSASRDSIKYHYYKY